MPIKGSLYRLFGPDVPLGRIGLNRVFRRCDSKRRAHGAIPAFGDHGAFVKWSSQVPRRRLTSSTHRNPNRSLRRVDRWNAQSSYNDRFLLPGVAALCLHVANQVENHHKFIPRDTVDLTDMHRSAILGLASVHPSNGILRVSDTFWLLRFYARAFRPGRVGFKNHSILSNSSEHAGS
jgi:hypothetical protein